MRMIISLIMLLFMVSPTWAEESKVHFHGYGELHYNGSESPDKKKIDMHRMVWGLSYEFNDKISLHTEIDFEHAAQEMELEYAHLDFKVNPNLNVRAGLMLMPVGPLNEFHEPPLFYSVERPQTQNSVIPTTWQEGGLGIFGATESGLNYRLYYVSGLNASGFSADKGIRGGRSRASGNSASGGITKAPISGDDFAVVGRLEYTGIPGFKAGVSGYKGNADQGTSTPSLGADVDVKIMSADLRYRLKGLDVTAVYAQVDIGNAANLSKVGEKIVGWYGEIAYDVLALTSNAKSKRLVLFARMEEVNTQDKVPTGVTADLKNDLTINTYGLAYYPISDIAFKIDWQNTENGTDSDAEAMNLGVTYMF